MLTNKEILEDVAFAQYMEELYTMEEVFDIIRMEELEDFYVDFKIHQTIANVAFLVEIGAISVNEECEGCEECGVTAGDTSNTSNKGEEVDELFNKFTFEERLALAIEAFMELENVSMTNEDREHIVQTILNGI